MNCSSSTITMHSLTGQACAHLLQPVQYSYAISYSPSSVWSKHWSGHSSQQRVHLVQRSKRTTGRWFLVVPRLKLSFRDWPLGPSENSRLTAGTAAPSKNSNHFGRTGISCFHSTPSPALMVLTVFRTSSQA